MLYTVTIAVIMAVIYRKVKTIEWRLSGKFSQDLKCTKYVFWHGIFCAGVFF